MQHPSGAPPLELATLTSKGQVTVPKAVREALGLRAGGPTQLGSGERLGQGAGGGTT
jgi:looped-hinge helix DNA binding domain, AbrB family